MTDRPVDTRDDQTASKPLYRRVLGNTYDSMPKPLQRMHDLVGNLTMERFGLSLPRALAPRGDSYEHATDGRFNFHVEIALPVVGLIVRYRGWLTPV